MYSSIYDWMLDYESYQTEKVQTEKYFDALQRAFFFNIKKGDAGAEWKISLKFL